MLVEAVGGVRAVRSNKNCFTKGEFVSHSAWTVSLSELWGIPTLPVLCTETQVEGGRRMARCAAEPSRLNSSDWFDLEQPVQLLLHRENKPWGSELWYTGIEKRGVSEVEMSNGVQLSLAAYLAVLQGAESCRAGKIPRVPLLKILDPLPEPEKGCLYIEVHREKWETYIVTAIDRRVWPSGRGQVLFGFSEEKMSSFGGHEEKFKAALQAQAKTYESIRRSIDAAPLNVSQELRHQELEAWRQLREFFGFLEVDVGSVVRVPPYIPHSLQNGVQVVEFQTPTYERMILAFNQKVLTQNHWDSEEAIRAAYFKTTKELIHDALRLSTVDAEHWSTVVEFPEFTVRRAILEPQASLLWKSHSDSVSLLFVVEGEIELREAHDASRVLRARAGQALLLPAHAAQWRVVSLLNSPAILLSV